MRRYPPDFKSILIQLNAEMDWLLSEVSRQARLSTQRYRPGLVQYILGTHATPYARYRAEQLTDIDAPVNSLYHRKFPTDLEKYVILLEDKYYWQHAGFDVRCIPRLIKQVAMLRRIGGMSTIEQQFVRSVLRRRERSLRRKFKEVLLAWILTYRATKEMVLRGYLSIAYFGYRLRGCDEASRFIFGKDAANLQHEEAAFVASLLVYPLPKHIQTISIERGYFPVKKLAEFRGHKELAKDAWLKKVTRRVRYGLRLARESKQTLQQIGAR